TRRRGWLDLSGAVSFRATAVSPLTLHLARASALENAGLCLHHLYGFAYLPGTGLKGMARAYAETVWFPTQFQADADGRPRDQAEKDNAGRAWRTIEAVFGWAPNSDAGKTWKPSGLGTRSKGDDAHAGQVVFHDAWPVSWPRLIEDILNSHHSKYYQDETGREPPGDWEHPVPVYFLAVAAGQTFEFALAKRHRDVSDELVSLARQWLVGALTNGGAGAKTNSGYGAFRLEPETDADRAAQAAAVRTWQAVTACGQASQYRRAEFAATLELVTPAFLAGAEQHGDDAKDGCDLRPATLRGLLRWWWRTLHAGFLDVRTLQRLEASLWGDTRSGGAVRILVEPVGTP
ncbi:MAG TPA: type III-B CRISPR module RAMP protein Cmr6, partial [Planctomycetaceae bacterium]|nr:type III-B CRISPR module RAMP protein Cmr6 [Planctomycetaceae bacterium]